MQSIDFDLKTTNSKAMMAIPDEVAIARVRRGDSRAFEIIMRRYNQRLYRTARSILSDEDAAQDAVQEGYITAYYKLNSYTPSGSFGAWLTRITINEALMIKRKPDNRVADNPTNIDNEELIAPNANPADTLANNELAGLIEAAIDVLPDTFRSVFVLRAVQQLSVRETAESLDIPEATVKTRFHRARSLIQENLNHSIQEVGLQAFEFAGQRCDRIVYSVLSRLGVELNLQDQDGVESHDKLH